jgi:hypothetical protein
MIDLHQKSEALFRRYLIPVIRLRQYFKEVARRQTTRIRYGHALFFCPTTEEKQMFTRTHFAPDRCTPFSGNQVKNWCIRQAKGGAWSGPTRSNANIAVSCS